ncbi:hypothetical protein NLI96_g659 [Meripilus lineatus]|uniref:Uncharacterized protein n=1 Tax=Meripilus lineatus TaxID=2056292 RepID=A0AAD5VHL3_9APHY|nr:hypothetical protein NLI96_g659 [Physisporinus lineatus]
MANIDPIALIENWLNQERGMEWAPQWDGGYERWAQGAWAVYFNVNYQGAITARPEQHVYNAGGQRADLVFQAHGQNPASVEMKCKVPTDSPKEFTDKVWLDVKKSLTGLNGNWGNATRWVLAISVTNDADRDEIGQLLGLGTHGGFEHHPVHAYAPEIDVWSWHI